jgi:molybdopterin converting factor small subunit
MIINVKLYGDLKRYAPDEKSHFKMIINPGATLEDAIRLFSIPNDGYVFLVNGRRIKKGSCLNEGDTLVLFPEISGG